MNLESMRGITMGVVLGTAAWGILLFFVWLGWRLLMRLP